MLLCVCAPMFVRLCARLSTRRGPARNAHDALHTHTHARLVACVYIQHKPNMVHNYAQNRRFVCDVVGGCVRVLGVLFERERWTANGLEFLICCPVPHPERRNNITIRPTHTRTYIHIRMRVVFSLYSVVCESWSSSSSSFASEFSVCIKFVLIIYCIMC